MRKIFTNRYAQGFDAGRIAGWDEGFEVGRKKALAESKRVFIKLIKEEIHDISNPMLVDKEFLDGLERAMEIIKGKK